MKNLLNFPFILKKHQHIILLSHMRAYTSLFGHILGSHPEIEGYYEMHIGYYSWKSLIRQKLLYFKQHKPKRHAKFMFDKILHNEHETSIDILKNEKVITVLSLREPLQTVLSIVKLYQKNNPEHEFATIEGATKYYLLRLDWLEKLALMIPGQYLYVDAESIKSNPEDILPFLTKKLKLSSNLLPSYSKQKNTASGNTGDHSENITLGSINKTKSNYPIQNIPIDFQEQLNALYNKTRKTLISKSKFSYIL